jgi:CshA-type fibril repeat protein
LIKNSILMKNIFYNKLLKPNLYQSVTRTGVILLLACGLWAGMTVASYAQTVTLTATADAGIWNNNATDANKNYGNCDKLYINGAPDGTGIDRLLIRFDLSSIPSSATITSATFSLVKTGLNNTSQTVNVHRITNDWTEGTGGCMGTNGVANWNTRMTGLSWTTAGGDFDATAIASVAVVGNATYNWSVTSLVQDWVSGTYSNYGLIVKYATETVDAEKEFAASENPTTANRPKLTVTYTLPGPGGVTAGILQWLRADKTGVSGGGGTPVDNWQDQTAAGRDAAQATVANQPILTSNVMNYNPGVVFDGTNDEMSYSDVGLVSGAGARATFVVTGITATDANNRTIFNHGTNSTATLYGFRKGGAGTFQVDGNAANYLIGGVFSTTDDHILYGGYTGTQVQGAYDGGAIGGSTVTWNTTLSGSGTLGAKFGSFEFYNGQISEVIQFSGNLSASAINKVNTYLAVKYGLTLDQTTPQNYTSSTGVIWNGIVNSGHANNITGIGRDDASDLNQKQSKSENAGGLVAMGNGNTIATFNATNPNNFSADNSFLIFGDNDGALAWQGTDATATRIRLTRRWKVQETGTVGSVKIRIPDNSSSLATKLPAENTAVYLLVDADGNFASGATEIAMTLTGTNWEADVDFTTGQFFTVATQRLIPTLSTAQTNVACFGAATGSINLTVTGGVSPYTYVWSNTATTQDISGLVAGTYTVTVTDALSSTATVSATITQPAAALAATGVLAPVSCNGGNNGSITQTVTGGTSPYTYLWANGGATTINRTGLVAGTYTVTITDNNSCTLVKMYTITQPAAALAVTATVTAITCSSSGAITLATSGGTSPYSYDWADISGANNVQNRTGLGAGTYTVTVTDANGCTKTSSSTLTTPMCGNIDACKTNTADVFYVTPDPNVTTYTWTVPAGAVIVSGQGTSSIVINWTGATPGVRQVCCKTVNSCGESAFVCADVNVIAPPTVTVTASPLCAGGNLQLNATGGVAYLWSGPGGFSSSISNPFVIAPTAGTYAVTVTSTQGCTGTGSVTVTINPSPTLAVTSVTPASCGGTNGAVNMTTTGGTTPYTFVWTNSATTEDISGLVAGAYRLTVTDANGCTNTKTAEVNNTTPPTVTAAVTNVTCSGAATGAISLTVSGGVSPYTYSWSNGASTQNISGLVAGTYNGTVTDNAGCKTIISRAITEPIALNLDKTLTNVNCFGGSTGAVNLIVTGGTLPYTYAWSNLPGSPDPEDQTGLAAGTYTVTVTYSGTCSATTSVAITQPAAALSVSTVITPASCNGVADGAISLDITGGTPAYTYNWGAGITSRNRSNLTAGTYTVTVTDAKGCTSIAMATVTQATSLAVSTSITNVSCFDGETGAVSLTVSGGTPTYSYGWSNGATQKDISMLVAGVYTVSVTDINGCTASTTANVTQPAAALSATAVPTAVLCTGATTGAINLIPTGGSVPYVYFWADLPGSSDPEDRINLAAGNYSVTIADNFNCTTTVDVTVSQLATMNLTATLSAATCNGAATGAIDLEVTGGTAPFSYNWGSGITSQDRSNVLAGTYTVTVTDANNCTSTKSFQVTQPTPLALSIGTLNVSCAGADNGTAIADVSGATAPYQYAWSNGQSTDLIINLAPGTYTVTIIDAASCTATAQTVITSPAGLSISGSNIIPNCPATSNGTIDITPAGGTQPYTYLWSNGAVTQDLSGIASGTFTVTVTDSKGCTLVSDPFVVEQLSLSLLVVAETCSHNDGEVYAVPAGGLLPYTYLWSNSGTQQDISGLSAGTYTVTVTAGACTATASTTLTAPVCNPPVAVNDNYTTPKNTPVSGTVASNDSDPDHTLSQLTFLPLGFMLNGSIDWDSTYNGAFNYVPNTGFVGIDSVYYLVCDPTNLCDTGLLKINVINNPPVAVNDTYTMVEDGSPITLLPLNLDTDPNADALSIVSINGTTRTPGVAQTIPVTNGTVNVSAGGTITFSPAANFNGTVTFPYVITDGLATATANEIITITPVNDPPVAVNDVATTPEDTPVTFPVTANDTDVDGAINPATLDLDPGTAGVQTTFTVAGQGTFVANPATGNVTFTPVLNYNGTTTPITYNVCDNGTPLPALCASATITVTVTPVNDPPVAVNDVATTPEDTPVTFPVTANDTDVDGAINPATLDLDPTTAGVQTTFTVSGQGTFVANPANGNVTFTPVLNYNGTTTPITYSVCDNGTPLPAQCATATITVTVTPVNDPPVANDDLAATPNNTPVNITILANDSDVDGSLVPSTIDLDPNTAGTQTTFTVASEGTYTVNPVTGIVTFTPLAAFSGTTTPITYSVCDNGTPLPSQCDQATITVVVGAGNVPPVALDDTATTPEDTPVTITILANDSDPDGSLVLSTIDLDLSTPGIQTTFTTAGQGTFVLNPATGIVTFTPVANYNGTTTPITYSVCDNGSPSLCDPATITVTVTPVNDPPVAVNDVATTPEDTPVTFPVTGNDTDIDGAINPATLDLDPSTAGVQTTFTVAGQGTFVANPANGNVTFTPVANYNGTTTPITYNVCDNGTPLPALCASATITVTVTPVNDPPVAVNDVATTPEDTPVTFPVTANDTDVDGAINPATLDLDPSTAGVQTTFTVAGQGTFVANPANGNVTFTPVSNYNGTTTPITYNVCDNGTPLPALCASATITVTVTPVNDPPVAVNDVATTPEDTPVTFPVTANDTDVDGAINPATLDLDPSTAGVQTTFTVAGQGTFVANPANGNVTFTPVSNYNGTTTPITYNVCDNGTPLPALCASATITVTVTPVNDPPVAVNDVATTPEDTPVTFPVTANDTDVDGAINPATLDLDPSTAGVQTTFTVAGQGTFVANPANGNVTFTPVSNYNGTTTPITYNVCDNGTPLPAQCATATITVTVTPVNDPPVAVNDVATTPEDTPVTFPVTGNDTDVDGAINPATLDLDPTTAGVQTTFTVSGQGTFVANPANGNVTFTPVANYNGTTTPITYNVCDNGTPLPALCASATITVTVTPVNDPPVAVNDVATTPEDTPVTFPVTGNDTDVDGAINPATLDLDPTTAGVQTTFTVAGQGTFVANPANGNVTFTPVSNYNGTTTPITYNVCDNGTPLPALCASATITVTVTPVNDPPVAVNDVATTPEDTPVTFPVTANDTDVDGTINPATLDLDPSTAGVQTTFTVSGQGTFVANPANGNVTFTPVLNYNGTTTPITYNVCDNGTPLPALCATATITVTVTPVNDPPVANDDLAATPNNTPVNITILANDSDVDGSLVPATIDLDPNTAGTQTTFTVASEGTYTVNPVTGLVTFTPIAAFSGTTTPITYSVCDNGTPLPAQCDQATITVVVGAGNTPPVALDDTATTPEDTPVTITILANDSDPDGSLVLSTIDLNLSTPGVQTTFTTAGQGTFVLNPATGIVTFTPVANYNGTTTPITYSVCDNGSPSLCDPATITVTVTPVNDPPVALNNFADTPEDMPVTFSLTFNDSDIDGAIDLASLDLNPSTAGIQTTFTIAGQGTFVYNPANGTVTFTPVANYNGTTTEIPYNVCDNGTPLPALCDDATITVTVTPVNDPPVAVNDVATTPEDTPVTFSVTGNDTDIDGTINPATLDLDPSTAGVQTTFTVAGQGTFVANPANGNVTFTPVANYNGTTTPITYSVCDNDFSALCATATITVTVTPANDPPVAINDAATTPEDTPVSISILSNDTDIDGTLVPGTIDLDVASPGIQTTLVVAGQGTFVVNPVTGIVMFTPVSNYNGTTTPITYNVCDNGTPLPSLCASATITVTITPVNDPPVAVNDASTTPEDTPVTFSVTGNDTDVDGTINPATLDLDPSTAGVQTTFTVAGQGTFVANPANGNVTFTPVANYNGTTTPITYNVCDNGTPLPALCASATITVTVTPVNDPPVAINDVATTPEDTPVSIAILLNDSDVDGTLVTGTIDLDPVTPGVQTTFTVAGEGTYSVNPASGIAMFTPVANYNGTTTPITYSVCDNGTPLPALCASATITVTITPANDPPVAVNDLSTTPEDTPVTFSVTGNDTDVDGAINLATFDLDPSTAGIQTTFTVAGQGTFVANPANGNVTFTPVANYNGTTTPITYSICDNGTPLPALCATATITVVVTPVNDPPVAVNDASTTSEDTPVTFSVTGNDTDVDGSINPATLDLDPVTAGIQTTFTVAGQGTFVANPATGTVTFTPVTNYNGTTTPITYSVCDNGTPLPSLCATATITVTVIPVNDPPVAVNDAATTPEDTPITFSVTGNDTDVDGSVNPATLDLDPATAGIQTTFTVAGQGTYVANPATGAVTFTPVTNYNGTATPITYSVCDNGSPLPALCAQAIIAITVTPDPVAKLQIKMLLQGALFGNGTDTLMRDNLRSGGYIPLTEPYTAFANARFVHRGGGGGETTTAAVLAANAGTPNAIVDWVFVELRNTADSSNVLITRSALIQRDGDIVSASDGVSKLTFPGIVGQQYFISVKHRNHLGVMTAGRIVMNNDSTLVDFIHATNAQVYDRPGSTNYNGMEQVTVQNNRRALWAGNANINTKVKYQGTASDNSILLAQVLAYPGNTLSSYNYNLAFGYFNGDINMDGKVKYQGPTNDATFIFTNVIGLYTLNTAVLYNYDLFLEQTPN